MAWRTFSAVRGRTKSLWLMVRETVAVDSRARAATSLMFMMAQITTPKAENYISVVSPFVIDYNSAARGGQAASATYFTSTNRDEFPGRAPNCHHHTRLSGADRDRSRQRAGPRHGVAGPGREDVVSGSPRVFAATIKSPGKRYRLWRAFCGLRCQRIRRVLSHHCRMRIRRRIFQRSRAARSRRALVVPLALRDTDRKSTRLNSSH